MARGTDRGQQIDIAIGGLLGGYWKGIQDARRGNHRNPFPMGSMQERGWRIGSEQFLEGSRRYSQSES